MRFENDFDVEARYVKRLENVHLFRPRTVDDEKQIESLKWQAAIYDAASQKSADKTRFSGDDKSATLTYNIVRMAKQDVQILSSSLVNEAYHDNKSLNAALMRFVMNGGNITVLTDPHNFDTPNVIVDMLKAYAHREEHHSRIQIYTTETVPLLRLKQQKGPDLSLTSHMIIGDGCMYSYQYNAAEKQEQFSFHDVDASENLQQYFQAALASATKREWVDPALLDEQRRFKESQTKKFSKKGGWLHMDI